MTRQRIIAIFGHGNGGVKNGLLLRVAAKMADATRGQIRLAGEENLRAEGVRQRIGYMSQKFSLYDDLTIRQIKRHGELDVLVTALSAANLAERAA